MLKKCYTRLEEGLPRITTIALTARAICSVPNAMKTICLFLMLVFSESLGIPTLPVITHIGITCQFVLTVSIDWASARMGNWNAHLWITLSHVCLELAKTKNIFSFGCKAVWVL